MIGPAVGAADPIASEVTVLRALQDQRWRTSAEMIDETGLLPLAVRATLRELVGRGLVRRSITGVRSGRWQITASGMVEAARQRVERPLR